MIQQAERARTVPVAPWSDDAYLEFSRTGRREGAQAMIARRRRPLDALVIAECLEDKGRFLPAINAALVAIADEPAWTLPAHDAALHNFRDHDYSVDLGAAATAALVGQTVYMLRDRLDPQAIAAVERATRSKVFDPTLRSLRGTIGRNSWIERKDNWNPVCFNGVVSAALALLPDVTERAALVAAAVRGAGFYFADLGTDGYSPEGPHYWEYGFSSYITLRETILRATANQVDLFDRPKVAAFARFGYAFAMSPGTYAPFGDTDVGVQHSSYALAYVNHSFALGRADRLDALTAAPTSPLLTNIAILFGSARPPAGRPASAGLPAIAGPDSFFPIAGVLVSRAAPGDALAATIKAGGDAMGHRHDDVGSYTIALSDEQPTGDPGIPVYNAKTFSAQRRTIKVVSSYGHPVPLVAGQVQIDSILVKPTVVSRLLSAGRDRMVIDLRAAYAVPSLATLTRSFDHRRDRGGEITIRDDFTFTSPDAFDVPIIAGGEWRRVGDDVVELWRGTARLRARIAASAPVEIVPEPIDDEGVRFTRIAIRFKQPQRAGFVAVTFDPASSGTDRIARTPRR